MLCWDAKRETRPDQSGRRSLEEKERPAAAAAASIISVRRRLLMSISMLVGLRFWSRECMKGLCWGGRNFIGMKRGGGERLVLGLRKSQMIYGFN